MTITLVAAVAENGVIGRDGGLPWRLSTDMKRFKAVTVGHPIIMGRKTWESFPRRPLPERTNIVVTRDEAFAAEGAVVVHSLEAALEVARTAPGGELIAVIGGGDIYRQTIAHADRLDITHVAAACDGDTLFPAIPADEWHEIASEMVPAGEKDDHASRYVIYRRKAE